MLPNSRGTSICLCLLNKAQEISYDVIKRRLLMTGYFSDTAPTHLITATLGGTVAVTACAPIDVMKSRVQASRTGNIVS